MPRLIEQRRCPHCAEELPEPKPRACPSCAGSLQQRHLKAGCLSSAPPLVLAALGLDWLLRWLGGR
jgi:predicted amidophosphoribosyltransferase